MPAKKPERLQQNFNPTPPFETRILKVKVEKLRIVLRSLLACAQHRQMMADC
jgi:hypothetical protein